MSERQTESVDGDLLERVKAKHAWFAGKWSLDDRTHPTYEPTVDLLSDVIRELEAR